MAHEVCGAEDLSPGEARRFDVGGRRVAVVRRGDGLYRAVADTCPHEAVSLAGGKVEEMWVGDKPGDHRASERCVIVCPWHNFEFDLDAGLSPCEPLRLRVKTYPVNLKEGRVIVYI